MADSMVERVARAIDGVQLFSRYNDFTSDAVAGLPIEVCRYCNWGEGQDGEDIEVIARFPGDWDVGKELPKMISERRARAAIEAMRKPTEGMTVAALMASDEHLAPTVEKFAAVHGFNTGAAIRVSTGEGRLWNVAYSAMIDAALKE